MGWEASSSSSGSSSKTGNPAGDLADLAGRAAVHLGHLPQRAAEPEAVVVRDHRRLGAGIVPEDVGQHVVPLVPGEIEIDVGRILPLGVEEALEEESGAERLDVGDAEAVAHDRVGHRAAAAVGGAVLDDVLHHQEVVGESLLADDAELVLQPVASHRGDGAVAPLGAGVGEGAEPPEGLVGLREAGRHDPALGNAIGAALGDRLRLAHRLGAVGEEADEVGGGAEPGVAGGGTAERRNGGTFPLPPFRRSAVPPSSAESVVLRWIARRRRWRAQSSGWAITTALVAAAGMPRRRAAARTAWRSLPGISSA